MNATFVTVVISRLGGGHSPSAEKGDFPHPCRLSHSRDVLPLPGSSAPRHRQLYAHFPRLTSLYENSVRVRLFVPKTANTAAFTGQSGPSDGFTRSRVPVGLLRFHGSQRPEGRGRRGAARGVIEYREGIRHIGLTDRHGQSQISRGVEFGACGGLSCPRRRVGEAVGD